MLYLQNRNEDIKSSGLKNIGVEPLDTEFTLTGLKEMIKNKKRKAKAFLLDQSIIAGIGNIYADEILFQAQIHPEEYVNNLSEERIAALHFAIRDRLLEGIKNNGTTIRDYVDAEGTSGGFQNLLSVYGKYNEECPICNTKLQKLVVAGRSTCFCPQCQKL
jgi:formamidopyrimidine-DNA glycosylase